MAALGGALTPGIFTAGTARPQIPSSLGYGGMFAAPVARLAAPSITRGLGGTFSVDPILSGGGLMSMGAGFLAPHSTPMGSMAGSLANIGIQAAMPSILGGLGLDAGLATGTGLASALGLGAGLGSIIPGIGTIAGALAAVLLPNLFKQNKSAIGDIQAVQAKGQPISPQSWNQAGFGPGGSYLPPQALLTAAPGQKNNAPLRDIAQAIAAGNPVGDGSWQKAGLPAGGGAYGALMLKTLGQAKAQNPLMPQGVE